MGQQRRTVVAMGVAATMILAACGSDDGGTAAGQAGSGTTVEVLASFYPIAEAAERVGGDRVSVTNLTPAGSEPHDLELTPAQVDDLEDAALVLVLGRGFQPGVEEVAERRDGATVEVLEVLPIDAEGEVEEDDHGHEEGDDHADEGEHADEEDEHADEEGEHSDEDGHSDEDDGHGHDEGGLDPHVWLDPTLMGDMVDEVTAALVEVDPEGAATFEANAAAYKEELVALDEEFEEVLDDCEGSTIVVSHEAFGWMADRYGLRQEGIAGLSPEAEPDPARLSELTDLVEDEGITTVFTETLVAPDVAETLAREAGVETAVLNPIEGLTDDQLADGATYASVMRENLAALAEALGCG